MRRSISFSRLVLSDRAAGSESKRVRLEPGSAGIQIQLTLPDQIPQAKSYRVKLIDEQEVSRNLPIEQQTDRTLLITIPADQITRGSYIIHLHAVTADGTAIASAVTTTS